MSERRKKAERKSPVVVQGPRAFKAKIEKGEFPVSLENPVPALKGYRVRLTAWEKDRVVVSFNVRVPDGGFKSFSVNVNQFGRLLYDLKWLYEAAKKCELISEEDLEVEL